jgi:integrase
VCFEWHQRPENVLAGHLNWTDYRPAERAGELVWLPLTDEDGPLFPELTTYLDGLNRLGVPIVLRTPRRKKWEPAQPFKIRYALERVREAAQAAGLPDDLTLSACRHGGVTELGDAELTEQGVMALSGHKTPQAARLYVKRTEGQRVAGARRRRAWIESRQNGEQEEEESQNGAAAKKSE